MLWCMCSEHNVKWMVPLMWYSDDNDCVEALLYTLLYMPYLK